MTAGSTGHVKQKKRELILASAKRVFQRQGFLDVTMKDIIDEAGISRGGIYLYFKSVDEIFVAVLTQRNRHTYEDVETAINKHEPFSLLFKDYLDEQKARLLALNENSLLRAAYEYYFTHKSPADQAFQKSQYDLTKDTVMAILDLGVMKKILKAQPLGAAAEQIMLMIEGLSVVALTSGISERQVDEQFHLLQKQLPYRQN